MCEHKSWSGVDWQTALMQRGIKLGMGVLLLLLLLLLFKQIHAHIWDTFISLIYLTNWLHLRATDVERYSNNKGVAPTEIK